MAIEGVLYPEAEDLVSKEKVFYPLGISVSHWQLRHYISHPEPDHLYYASSHDVYCLYTSSTKRKHIATLPFEARCTASGYGWVCVGGEDDGHFAAIKIDGCAAREVDDRLDAEPTPRREADVKVERIGEEIVNSISIHRVQDEEAHMDDIVAVLTNNDKTVRVYSLPQSLETSVLDLPFAMNHATISPDGTMLVAVGDVNQAYFFRRDIRGTPPIIPKPHNRLTSGSIDWRLSNVVSLHVSGPEASIGYFTTAWSPNGQLVAVGSEGGYITVMDMDLLAEPELDDEDAVVAVVPSSRPDVPQPHPGAVRTMIFSPDPWDLLIWAEDQGRVCVGDLRTGLKSKQVVSLDPKEEGLRRMEFEDMPQEGPVLPEEHGPETRNLDQLERDFLRRYQHAQDNPSAVNFATEYLEARRRQRQHRQEMASLRVRHDSEGRRTYLEDDPQGLTAREQEILAALRTTRQREELRAQGGPARGVNYTTPDMFGSSNRPSVPGSPDSTNSTTSPAAEPFAEVLSSAGDTFPELARTSAASTAPTPATASSSQLPPIRVPDDASTRNPNPSRLNTTSAAPSRLPRRRASIILDPPSNPSTASPPPAGAATTPHPDDDNPWRTIEDVFAQGPLFTRDASSTSASTSASTNTNTAVTSTRNAPTPAELATSLASERAARARAQVQTRARAANTAANTASAQNPNWRSLIYPPTTGANTTALPTALTDIRRFPVDGYESVLRRVGVVGRGATGREVGVRTAGLAISGDGGTLWVACEEGLFEVRVKRGGRMFWPAVELL